MIVIIPSIRNINNEYLESLLAQSEVRVIVVDDSDEERITPTAPNMTVLHYSDRHRLLGRYEACIPRKNGACRDLGLWFAYREGGPDEVVVCLDDDCQVYDRYYEQATNSLGEKELPLATTARRFYNPLDLCQLGDHIYPRGFPYEERVFPKDYCYATTCRGNVVFNLGLWHGIFDVNAIDKLYLEQYSFDDYTMRYPQVAVQSGALVSLCSMNMIMRREVIPAIYQLPMNEPVIPDWRIDRYGDIWGGYICKKLIDIKGDILSVGDPLIYHHKEPELLKNIRQEHYAHLMGMRFCDLLDQACEKVSPDSYLMMYDQFTTALTSLCEQSPEYFRAYLTPACHKMRLWVDSL